MHVCWWIIMFCAPDSNERFSCDTYDAQMELICVFCWQQKSWSAKRIQYFKFINIGDWSEAAANHTTTVLYHQFDKNNATLSPMSSLMNSMPSKKDLAYIRSTFFLHRLFSVLSNFTGLVCTCRFLRLNYLISVTAWDKQQSNY